MNARLRSLYDQLENERRRLLLDLGRAAVDNLDRKPSNNKWSINEILAHLVTSEQLTLRYLKKKSLGVDQLRNSGAIEKMKWIILKVSQRLPIKYKAPGHVVINTPAALSLTDLIMLWTSTREELRDFLTTIKDENLNKLVYKHPVAGRFDVVHCLMFMREHYLHHLPQIRRLL